MDGHPAASSTTPLVTSLPRLTHTMHRSKQKEMDSRDFEAYAKEMLFNPQKPEDTIAAPEDGNSINVQAHCENCLLETKWEFWLFFCEPPIDELPVEAGSLSSIEGERPRVIKICDTKKLDHGCFHHYLVNIKE